MASLFMMKTETETLPIRFIYYFPIEWIESTFQNNKIIFPVLNNAIIAEEVLHFKLKSEIAMGRVRII